VGLRLCFALSLVKLKELHEVVVDMKSWNLGELTVERDVLFQNRTAFCFESC
jgi:hypothetical protein